MKSSSQGYIKKNKHKKEKNQTKKKYRIRKTAKPLHNSSKIKQNLLLYLIHLQALQKAVR